MRLWTAPAFLFDYDFNSVSAVFYDRYPNSFAKHIVSEDVLSREITDDKIVTRKLIVKKAASFLKSVPSWMTRLTAAQFMPTMEESVYDRKTKTLTTYTRNISWNNILHMDERCVYRPFDEERTELLRSLYLSVTYGRISGLVERFLFAAFKNSIRKTADGFNEKLKERFGQTLISSTATTSANTHAKPSTKLIQDSIMKKLEKA